LKEPKLDVAVVGNAGVDTNVYFHGREPDFTVESNFTENIDCVGQAGGFSARGFARLGKRTAFIGAVGEDPNGRWIRETFTQDGIDTSGLFVDPAGTCRSINLMYGDGRRKNFYDGKGHMSLEPDLEVCTAVLKRARLAHFHIPNWARHLLPLARKAGVTISCDIQDVVDLADPYRADFIREADVLFFSTVNHPDPTPMIEKLLEREPVPIVVSGMGPRGCALGTSGGIRLFGPVELDAPVADTNGAGDSLAVGFLSSYFLDGHPLEDAVLRGQIAARWKCSQRATSSELICRAELDRLFRALRG
jgi:sugar/nucleoside kinase (ribokinase family)